MKIVQICGASHTPDRLRGLAKALEEKGNPHQRVTVVVGTDVYCWGPVSEDRAAEGAIFDLTYAIHKMMGAPVKHALEEEED